MDQKALIRRLMTTFVGELEEHVRTLEHELLALERAPDPASKGEIYKTLFRAAHSLKGAARSVNVEPIETAAHRLESLFADVRDGALHLNSSLFEILFAAVDVLRDAGRRLTTDEDLAGGPLSALLPKLEAARSGEPVGALPGIEAPQPKRREPEIAAAPPPVFEEGAGTSATDETVRISVGRLERLVTLGGELVVARRRATGRGAEIVRALELTKRLQRQWHVTQRSIGARHEDLGTASPASTDSGSTALAETTREDLDLLARQLDGLALGLATDDKLLDQVAAPLEAELLRARMEPFARTCEGFGRLVRDIARTSGKEVDLVVTGGEVEIDRSVLEVVKDPLIHLVRNAVDHGIETPAARAGAGKPPRGRVALTAALRNGQIEITVADDGRGLDLEAIRKRARDRNIAVPTDSREVARLVFAPGFSTATTVSEVSGRGIGLDVVKTAVELNRGSVDIAFEPGSGTRVVLKVPLSLTRLPALLVSAGGQICALDRASVRALRRVEPADLQMIGGRHVVSLDGGPIPVVSLSDILGLSKHESSVVAKDAGAKIPLVVLGIGSDSAAFIVDELVADEQIVVKDLGSRLRRLRLVLGATVLPTGRIALIPNTAELLRAAHGRATDRSVAEILDASGPSKAVKRLLVADDSVTTRTLIKSVLEAAGYEVTTAADGGEAWQLLQEKGADLLVSDVEMPRMDGFTLTEAVRGSKRLRDLPIVLVTALASEQDRRRGLEAGADAYLLKSAFDQTELLETIGQFL